ncbi:MAG: TetR/AcrR family transcriptional regulator [Tannerella sp.]|jgi:AcrR family transcriptional regulator|nr:TetR/AcrR family transcriptional regulator [Tannerella sp.]
MLRDHIVKTAAEHYARYGIKSVSMNQIAQELRISKKTLYTEFDNKTQLISECITLEMEYFLQKIIQVKKDAASSLEALYKANILLIRRICVLCPAFHMDIQRIPDVTEKFESYKDLINEQLLEIYKNGVKEESLLPEIDFMVIMGIYTEQLHKLNSEKQGILLKAFLQGVCTEQGRCELKNISKANQYS